MNPEARPLWWVPSTKRELVGWLAQRFPQDAQRYGKMKKQQLYAIYFNARRALEVSNNN
jgi:hypothetical protein